MSQCAETRPALGEGLFTVQSRCIKSTVQTWTIQNRICNKILVKDFIQQTNVARKKKQSNCQFGQNGVRYRSLIKLLWKILHNFMIKDITIFVWAYEHIKYAKKYVCPLTLVGAVIQKFVAFDIRAGAADTRLKTTTFYYNIPLYGCTLTSCPKSSELLDSGCYMMVI